MMQIYRERISEFTEEEYNKAFKLLSEERKQAVLRMRFENDRKRSVLGEYLARKAISNQTGISEKDIKILRTENGKPFCENANIHFSIAHSKDMVVCAVDDFPIGIDVEFIRPLDMRITRFACTDKDLEFINSSKDQKEKELLFFKLWTAKEAFIKFHGKVLADLKTIKYEDIKDNCVFYEHDGYMVSVYSVSDKI